MKNVKGAIAQKGDFLKSIVLALLVCIVSVTFGCSDAPKKAITDIGGGRGQELRKEASSISEIGGGKTIRGELSPVTDIGGKSSNVGQIVFAYADIGGSKSIKNEFTAASDIGGKNTNGTIHFSERKVSNDIGGKSSTIGQISFAFVDIGGRKDLSTGNVYGLLVLDSDIGGKDRDIIKICADQIHYDIGGGGKNTTSTLN